MKEFLSRAVLFVVLAALPATLAAVSVFDVIRLSQGRYSDEEIIRLIQTTDSRFLLSADDTVRLRQAGVSDSVIREMLSRPAPPPERESEPSASRGSAGPATLPPRAGQTLFTGSPYSERGADRPHAAVTLAGIEVLILRDRGGFPSALARARSVAQTLNRLAASGSGRFAARDSGRDSHVIFQASDGAATDLVLVSPADAATYRVAGRREESAGALASFWAALLNDYWAIGVAGRPPRYLVDFRDGQALERLSLAVRPRAGVRDAESVRAALDSLGRSDRERLRKLPTAVPEDLDFSVRRLP